MQISMVIPLFALCSKTICDKRQIYIYAFLLGLFCKTPNWSVCMLSESYRSLPIKVLFPSSTFPAVINLNVFIFMSFEFRDTSFDLIINLKFRMFDIKNTLVFTVFHCSLKVGHLILFVLFR